MRINILRQQVKNDQALDFLLQRVSKRVMQYIDDWRPFNDASKPYLPWA